MAERMSTRTRMDRIRANGKISRQENGLVKRKERANRDKRMAEIIGKTKFPYAPSVMSYLSQKLGKPSTQITEAEAKEAVK
ncbi:MAG: hypothetical protein ACRC8S_08070 [Fimbriiglobus sp.]